ncbi:MAG TPA: helix-turn-helix transcriptional regulator [Gaiellaceae bacterium]|nr:helix-turn-helix transcriptional regulator [Gaiellaceae bacterium]
MADEDARYSFPDNLERLLGLHRLTSARAAKLIGVSPTTLSYWRNGKQTPGARTQHSLLVFFELDYWDLNWRPFGEILEGPLADRARFERVEAKIRGE